MAYLRYALAVLGFLALPLAAKAQDIPFEFEPRVYGFGTGASCTVPWSNGGPVKLGNNYVKDYGGNDFFVGSICAHNGNYSITAGPVDYLGILDMWVYRTSGSGYAATLLSVNCAARTTQGIWTGVGETEDAINLSAAPVNGTVYAFSGHPHGIAARILCALSGKL